MNETNAPSNPSTSGRSAGADPETEFGEQIDLLGPLVVLGRKKRLLVAGALIGGLLALAFSLVWPAMYTATTRILPPSPNTGAAGAILTQVGGAAAGALGSALGVKTPAELYVGMLRSDSVADALIDEFALMAAYSKKLRVDARRKLADRTRIAAGKDGIIVIEVEDRDRERAARLANAYVTQLHRLTSTLAVSDAAQRRVFFERQLETAKNRLADAEVALQKAVATKGIASAVGQAGATLETMARLRAQIAAKQIQIEAMGAYATQDNPDRRRLGLELAAMRDELARLEGRTATRRAEFDVKRDVAVGAAGAADSGLDNIRLLREVKYFEVLFELLARQYEIARLDESREAPLVQVLDAAAVPEKKSFPRLSVLLPLGVVVGFIVGVVAAFARNALDHVRADPSRRRRLGELRSAWFPDRARPSGD